MKIISLLFLSLLLVGVPAAADQPPPITHAHPALWHVKGKLGDVYLFGSIHALPTTLQWHTPRIDRAIARADVFVFEVSNEAPSLQHAAALVAAHGLLPPGQSLRALLTPAARADYDADIASVGLTPEWMDNKRPWLASLFLTVAQMKQEHYQPEAGVDRAMMAAARAAGKPMRYFETIDQQFALLAPDGDKLELSEFESGLEEFRHEKDEMTPLVDAWSKGDPSELNRLMNADLNAYPDAKKALLDDRNKRWVLQIETMLLEKRTFFITAGAGHLAGPMGVPALLRRAGYRVEGP
ncbi:MAG TPA: TraB/GumN family protein [Rhizomicrobium sp.]